MPHNILLYADEKTATGSMLAALKTSFDAKDFNILKIRSEDIQNGVLRDPQSRILILPGITGEISPYTAQLDHNALQEIRDFVTLRPNIFLTICAGSYFVSRETVYAPDWSAPRGRQSLSPLFNGVARGPVSSYGRPTAADSPFDDVVVIPVHFQTKAGTWEKTGICYGNGPALYPDTPDDPAIEILATYADAPGEPCAILRQVTGKGTLYMSCVLPEIGYQYVAPRRELSNARALMRDLKPHEQGRQKLWNNLITRIKQDLNL